MLWGCVWGVGGRVFGDGLVSPLPCATERAVVPESQPEAGEEVRVLRPRLPGCGRGKGRVFWFLSSSTWSTSVCVCPVHLIREEVTGVSCSNPVGCWPFICFPGCHYRHFQNLIPQRTNRLGFTLRAHT